MNSLAIGKKKKSQFFMVFLLCLLGVGFSTFTSVTAQDTTTYGTYEFTMYISGINGAFVGTTTMSETTTNENISTYFGDYHIVSISSQSDCHLNHDFGYIGLEDDATYYDSSSIRRKSEVTFLIRLDGYQRVTYTATSEYSSPHIIENSDTVFDRTYVQRNYEDGVFQESVTCRDTTYLGDNETVTVEAGMFDCVCLITYFYEDAIFTGYSEVFVDDDGNIIEQNQYDESDDLVGSLELLSLPPEPITIMFSSMTIPLIGLITGVVALIGFALWRSRRKHNPPSPYGEIPIPM